MRIGAMPRDSDINWPWCMAVAIDELAVIDPTQLYQRFLGWLLNVNQVCRVCAKPRHDAIPAVPPRLVPCAAASSNRYGH